MDRKILVDNVKFEKWTKKEQSVGTSSGLIAHVDFNTEFFPNLHRRDGAYREIEQAPNLLQLCHPQ
ncbi:hypothetical protein [Loigolactobacillus zhaoyuanensis]|uniref:hypothetical protein n=1 Tax=Loigolactobacillus zhaoyuanensis TaxID=2486017 RepID=UPI0013DDBC74|nr:hypothetical protein [Loigolactobacillus zhaoyuanensis]